MTLITFQSRIHFASNVLEEALRGEIEEQAHRSVLIVRDRTSEPSVMEQQVMIGLPARVEVSQLEIGTEATKHETRDDLARLPDLDNVDAVIAFGSARAIRHGRICRQAIAKTRYQSHPSRARTRVRERDMLPWFCVIPGVDGLPDPCLDAAGPAYKTVPPSVIICDPALIVGADVADEARAFASTLGRCLAALGCEVFNPMADGLAVEGLRRLQLFGQITREDERGRSRELMAAMLNGAIAQQKGPGLIQVLAHELSKVTGRETDAAGLQKVLLPAFLREKEVIPANEVTRVARVLGLASAVDLPDAVQGLFDPLPLARTLRDLKVTQEELRAAARTTNIAIGQTRPMHGRLAAVLEQHY